MAPVIVEPQQPSVEPLEDVTVFEYRDDPGGGFRKNGCDSGGPDETAGKLGATFLRIP